MNDITTIQRCPHDPEHPYFMLSRAVIRDNTISPGCRFFITYFLSMSDKWKISIKQFMNEFSEWDGWGKKKTYQYLKEAIEAGYIRKEEYFEKGLKRIKYYLTESPQKNITVSPIREVVKEDTKERQKKRQTQSVLKNGILPIMPIQETARDLPTSDPNGITVFSLDEGIFPDGSKLSLQATHAFAKYNDQARERLEANVRYFNAQIALGMHPKKSYECWLQDCINKDYASKQTNTSQNDLYAKFIKEMHNLNNQELYIMKTIVKLNGDSIDKKLPPSTFKQIIDNFIRNRR